MQSTDISWPAKPPEHPWAALTADEILDEWRDRIEKVATEESEHLASLPYVKGIAVIGSTGRGSPWPLSDVDMLTVVDQWHGGDHEQLIRQEECERNARLAQRGIPNTIEPSEWVVLADDLCDAATEGEDAFFARLEHPHWLGIVIKAVGGRVFHDATGQLATFLRRCDQTFYSDRFIDLWLRRVNRHTEALRTLLAPLRGRGDSRTPSELESVSSCLIQEHPGFVRLTSIDADGAWARTRAEYRAPLRVRLRARTDGTMTVHSPIGYLVLNFNWGTAHQNELLVHDKVNEKAHYVKNGHLAKGKWHEVIWEVGEQDMRVFANGQLLFSGPGEFGGRNGSVGVSPAHGSTVDVSFLVIEPLESPSS